MSSHTTPTNAVSPNHQRELWEILSCQHPASIMKTLKSTPGIQSYELHLLYTILDYCQFRTPDHLFTKIHTLPNPVAAELVSALKELPEIQSPVVYSDRETDRKTDVDTTISILTPGTGPVSPTCKPLFYTAEREELYTLVQRLFAKGYLNDNGDGSKRAEIQDFETLHILYRLEAEQIRAKKYGHTDLTEPEHTWYHETSNALVAQWIRYLGPLVPHLEEGENSCPLKLEFE